MNNLNQYMHPRNPFRMKPNFADLASRHLDLAEHVQTTSKGKSRIDFECAEAVRALTRVLLLEAFELNVKFDSERLVPAVPQRMNYLLWIQDIYRTAGCGQPWTGLDLGTGACSILPLLGCRIEPNWSFVASEVDARSACNATANIYTNHLESRISVVQTDERDPLLKLADGNKPISFVVCNPPFFDAGEDPAESCMFGGGRRPKSSANSAAPFEVACEGGELSFVQRLYQESEQIGTKIKVYSVMLGRKSTFVALKRMLNERAEHVRFVHSELCQGRTIRHALAWTFDSTLALDQVPILRHKKSKAPLSLVVAADGRFKYMYHLAAIERELIQLLRNELQLPHVEIVGGGSDKRRIHIRSHVNTWSNQRRRRRQVQQEMTTNMSSMHIPDSPSTNDSQDRQSGDHQSPSSSSLDGLRMSDKRRRSSVELAESNSYIDVDPKEIELASNEWKSSKKPKVFATQLDFDATDRQMYLLHAEIIITMSDDVIRLSMRDLEFSCDSQSTYQLFQLIKNRI